MLTCRDDEVPIKVSELQALEDIAMLAADMHRNFDLDPSYGPDAQLIAALKRWRNIE